MKFNDRRELVKILNKLHKFKKYNKPAYKSGMKNYERFLYYIDIGKKGVHLKKHIYDLSSTALNESLNAFISITVALPAKTSYINGERIRDLELDVKLREIVDELYLYSMDLLEYMAESVNKDWEENKNIYSSPVISPNHKIPRASNVEDKLYSDKYSIYNLY